MDYKSKRKIILIGAGLVGMSFAYAAMGTHACDELGIIDIDKKRAWGEASDLSHGLAFSGGNMKIYAAEYEDCSDADLAVICAGVPQKPGEDRISLYSRNCRVFDSILDPLKASGFRGILLVASNPVDMMTLYSREHTGYPKERVIGSGTTLDSARLRYLLGSYFGVDPRNVHAYVMGEHGDSEFVPWSQAYLSTKSLLSIVKERSDFSMDQLYEIENEVREAAYRIIEAKRATYYGIGMALLRIVKAVLSDEGSVLTLSACLDGEYGQSGIYVGVPCIVGAEGVKRVLTLDLTDEEREKLAHSCNLLRQYSETR
ncbi:MAG: L-lactate dehydrogenase [Eubacteriales bacterium]